MNKVKVIFKLSHRLRESGPKLHSSLGIVHYLMSPGNGYETHMSKRDRPSAAAEIAILKRYTGVGWDGGIGRIELNMACLKRYKRLHLLFNMVDSNVFCTTLFQKYVVFL